MSEIATGKTEVVWAKLEAVQGTFLKPAAADAVLVISDTTGKQTRIFKDDKQKRSTLSKLGQKAGPYNPGEWALSAYIKPSGSIGVAPCPAQLIEALAGYETISAGVSVTYSLYKFGDAIKTLSMIIRKGWDVHFISGAFVNKGSIPVKAGDQDDAIFQAAYSGEFLKSCVAGTDELSAAIDGTITPVTVIPVKKPKRHEAGTYIIVGSDDNSGAGFEVTSVDIVAEEVTIVGGVTTVQPIDSVVKGWTPDVSESGELIHGRFGMAQTSEDGVSYDDFIITEELTEITNNFKILNDEKTGDSFPQSMTKNELRDITIKVDKYFYPEDSARRYDANNQTRFWLKIPVGDVAGKRARQEF